MKKVISFLAAALIVMPVVTKADEVYAPNCGNPNAEGVVTCTPTYSGIESPMESITVTLTEHGGSEILDIYNAANSEWTVANPSEINGVWTVTLTSPGTTGEGDLFTFTYKKSTEQQAEPCYIGMSVNGQEYKTPEIKPDSKEENKQTGSTLPYIALGMIALIATGAYLATKNKAKMYRI